MMGKALSGELSCPSDRSCLYSKMWLLRPQNDFLKNFAVIMSVIVMRADFIFV